ncbi:Uncharacterised protein [Vibrio cholerae]|nr:Uncharacterised protein [Vibrio cholerae]
MSFIPLFEKLFAVPSHDAHCARYYGSEHNDFMS